MILPFKGGSQKSRLSSVLDAEGRHELSLLMLGQVLEAVAEAELIGSCIVVSSDPEALSLAESKGARPAREGGNKGVNSAVLAGVRAAEGPVYVVIPADLPLISGADLKRALAMRPAAGGVVISPSVGFDGTNLLLFSKRKRPALSYDRNSFWNHVGDAARRGCALAVYTGRGVTFDVDTVGDLKALGEAPINSPSASFAVKALKRWGS